MKREKHTRKFKWPKVLALAGIALLLLLMVGYLARGWLRNNAVQWYTNTFVKPNAQQAHSEEFGAVNDRLAQFGIRNWSDTVSHCSEPRYDGLGVSTGCYSFMRNGAVDDFDSFKSMWQTEAGLFDAYMKQYGWQKSDISYENIAAMFDTHPGISTTNIGYSKKLGKTTCGIRIGYNEFDTAGRKVFVDESCSRSIELFGGY